MPDYSKGKIYTIRCHNDSTLIYVGSTIQPLSKRWGGHKLTSRHKPHFPLYQAIDNSFENWYIELYENFSCENREQLCRREGQVIREIGNLNEKIAGRTNKEYKDENVEKIKEYGKQYYKENAEKIKECGKKYREQNAEKLKEYKKEYQKENAEKIKEYGKQYYKENAEKIKEYQDQYYKSNAEKMNEQILCECGAIINKKNLALHRKTQKHINYINEKNDI